MNYKTIIIGIVLPIAIWVLAGLMIKGILALSSPVTVSVDELLQRNVDEFLQRELGPLVSVRAATKF